MQHNTAIDYTSFL